MIIVLGTLGLVLSLLLGTYVGLAIIAGRKVNEVVSRYFVYGSTVPFLAEVLVDLIALFILVFAFHRLILHLGF